MGYKKIETQNAIYNVIFGMHYLKTSQDILPADAYIFEGIPEYGWTDQKQFGKLIEHAKKNNMPIFITGKHGKFVSYTLRTSLVSMGTTAAVAAFLKAKDTLVKLISKEKKIPRRKVLKILGRAGFSIGAVSSWSLVGGIPGQPVLIPFTGLDKKGEISGSREKLRKTLSELQRAIPGIAGALRSAWTAEQAESIIASLLKKGGLVRIHGKKPVINIGFGAGHPEIVEYLKNSGERKRLIRNYPLKKLFLGNIKENWIGLMRYNSKTKKWNKVKIKGFSVPDKKSKPLAILKSPKKVSRRRFFGRTKKMFKG